MPKHSKCDMVGCTKSINVFKYECKCGRSFCIKHVSYEEHDCDFNIKLHGKSLIHDKNPTVIADKLQNRI
jgi:hypothetical protein